MEENRTRLLVCRVCTAFTARPSPGGNRTELPKENFFDLWSTFFIFTDQVPCDVSTSKQCIKTQKKAKKACDTEERRNVSEVVGSNEARDEKPLIAQQ